MFLSRFRRPPNLRHTVITTFHAKGYDDYGSRCIQSFIDKWPQDVKLLVYAEGVTVREKDARLIVIDQQAALPKLAVFKESYRENPFANGTDPKGKGGSNNFRWDAVRFSNKVFAVTDALRRSVGEADQLIWLDADTVTHTELPRRILDELAPRDAELAAYLNRKTYPECGWVGYNLNHAAILSFADRFEQIYLSGDFLNLKESHDSYVFWDICKKMQADGEAKFKFLGSDYVNGHIFINSILGGYIDHLKGDRKEAGRSRISDLYTPRKETWWQQ